MPNKPEQSKDDAPPTTETTDEKDTPPAGEGEAANDPGLEKKGDGEETMPMEEGFSIVP